MAHDIALGALRQPQPCVLVIFGGDGDLGWRKLLPAVYNLNVDAVLPSHFAVVCFGLPSTEEGKTALRFLTRDATERSLDATPLGAFVKYVQSSETDEEVEAGCRSLLAIR